MRLSTIIVLVFCYLSLAMVVATLAISLSRQGCDPKCGELLTIPYPFGIGSKCSGNPNFTIICHNSTTPILSSIGAEVLSISLLGTITVNQPVSPMNCSKVQGTDSLSISLKGSPFTISAGYNTLAVLGCEKSVWLVVNGTTRGGCTALCSYNTTDLTCRGVACCQIAIPTRLQELRYIYQSNLDSRSISNTTSCGYVFPVDKRWFRKDYFKYEGLMKDLTNPFDAELRFAPLVLQWEFGGKEIENKKRQYCRSLDSYELYPILLNYNSMSIYDFSLLFSYLYGDLSLSSEETQENGYISSIRYCTCLHGFEGNPYLPQGCSDVDECANGENSRCKGTCINTTGSFKCRDNRYRLKIAFIAIGTTLGALVLVLGVWKLSKSIKRRIKANRRRKFFKRNGGLLLEQELSATASDDHRLQRTLLYSSKELTQATDHYNENRVLGRGGQGTVYKGMLADGRIVAIKKSKRVEEGDLQVFINEVVILSQLNHRNIVKLLGCCLETEVPLLVYEFIPNGTLFQHIHKPNEEFALTWQMRLRIAREVAGALAYLHSAASAPIYHRDIKSTNILLDDKYHAKIADFGTSRSVSIDQTHLTTRVLGTFGYFDPEYFQSSQFTDKSDVYSFGVVMVELLTGEKAVSSVRIEEGRGLATYFLHSMEENQLFDILDQKVLEQGSRVEIVAVADLARRCLHLNGKSRPTMKEVVVELEAIQMKKGGSSFMQNEDGRRECNNFEVADDVECHNEFSSISATMNFDSTKPLLPPPLNYIDQ